LKKRIEEVKGEHRPQSLAMQAGQIYRFIHELSIGDLVVLPREEPAGQVAVGRVVGDFTAERPNELWGADLTYLRCWEGVTYLVRGPSVDRQT
jgi:predicted Mrr-cat superfamily restriction endonuclease